MKKEKVVYNGGKNPYRYGSKDYYNFKEQKDWWMNNLNLAIITDYLRDLDLSNTLISSKLEDLEMYKDSIEDKKYQ